MTTYNEREYDNAAIHGANSTCYKFTCNVSYPEGVLRSTIKINEKNHTSHLDGKKFIREVCSKLIDIAPVTKTRTVEKGLDGDIRKHQLEFTVENIMGDAMFTLMSDAYPEDDVTIDRVRAIWKDGEFEKYLISLCEHKE